MLLINTINHVLFQKKKTYIKLIKIKWF